MSTYNIERSVGKTTYFLSFVDYHMLMKINSKSDRRVRKTESAIFSALTALLREKPLGDISIRELTEKADVHRATFYDHYTDINDCFEALQSSILDEINSVLKSSPELDYPLIYANVLSYVKDNQNVLSILLGRNGSAEFQDHLASLIKEDYLENIHHEYPNLKQDATWDYIASYHTNGNIGMINCWIDNDCSLPSDKMVQLMLQADSLLDSMFDRKASSRKTSLIQ